MAKSRRKASGCCAGKFKRKRMGKGWLTAQVPKNRPRPVKNSVRDAIEAAAETAK